MANKEERIQTLIRKNIAEIIQFELKNPHLGFVSVNDVWVSKDISYAKVYVSFINENEAQTGLDVLNHSRGFVRSSLAKKMDTRRIPEISFVLDEGYKRVERIEELLKK
ncbi:MAG: 30S ribosome-binding factor RbfA [Bacilli bacterium]|nr:30S ribosome-binding factor RbfA [Bacilli bacterium]